MARHPSWKLVHLCQAIHESTHTLIYLHSSDIYEQHSIICISFVLICSIKKIKDNSISFCMKNVALRFIVRFECLFITQSLNQRLHTLYRSHHPNDLENLNRGNVMFEGTKSEFNTTYNCQSLASPGEIQSLLLWILLTVCWS